MVSCVSRLVTTSPLTLTHLVHYKPQLSCRYGLPPVGALQLPALGNRNGAPCQRVHFGLKIYLLCLILRSFFCGLSLPFIAASRHTATARPVV